MTTRTQRLIRAADLADTLVFVINGALAAIAARFHFTRGPTK